ncbi:MAG: hypothetical protein AAFX45_00215 [Pseudomonadota bacterium]
MRGCAPIAAAILCATAALAEDVTLNRDMLVPAGNGMFDASGLTLPDLAGAPTLAPGQTAPGARLLRHLATQGQINGHNGVVYDNRDRGHSTLPKNAFPGLTRLHYGEDMGRGDYGLATRIRLPATVIGNSSTAVTTGARPRSLPRLAMTTPGLPRQIYSLYVNNHLYAYPEHRDHDAVDLFPAAWPLTVTSQGSSGSDKPLLDAFLMSLAAFQPDTMTYLQNNGLVAPTLQMLLRRNLLGVESQASYLSSLAHPSAFDREAIRTERMVGHAASLTPSDIAPMVRLSVQEDGFSHAAGLLQRSEVLFDTPVAIARLWRGFEGRKHMRLSAVGTHDPLGRDIRYRWVLLRGDPEKVQIKPSDDTATADITIDWHDAFIQPTGASRIQTSRVDIGVFAQIGEAVGAPSFISISFPTHQNRLYSGPNGSEPRLVSIDYDAVARQAGFDPVLYWTAPWTDAAVYDAGGALTGWDRKDASRMRFVPFDDTGPGYRLDGSDGSLPTVVEVPR